MNKTYLDDLLDKYPHCMIIESGYPRICRSVLYEGKYCDGSRGYDCYNCWHEEMQEDAPAVPHEMSAREYVIARRRLCNAHLNAVNQCVDDFVTRCARCLIEDYCEGVKDDVDEEIAIVEAWAKEYPERSIE